MSLKYRKHVPKREKPAEPIEVTNCDELGIQIVKAEKHPTGIVVIGNTVILT